MTVHKSSYKFYPPKKVTWSSLDVVSGTSVIHLFKQMSQTTNFHSKKPHKLHVRKESRNDILQGTRASKL